MDTTQVNWRAFIGGKAVLDIKGGAALGGSTYWGEIKNIGQDGDIVHIFYDGRAAVMEGAGNEWRLSNELHHEIQVVGAHTYDLEGGGVSLDASGIRNMMLFVFPKGFKPNEGETYQWAQVHGTNEWLGAHDSGHPDHSQV